MDLVSVQGRTSTPVPIFDQDLHTSPTVLDSLCFSNSYNNILLVINYLIIDRLIFAVITPGLIPGCTWSLCQII